MNVIVRRTLLTFTGLVGILGVLLFMQNLSGRIPTIEVVGPEVSTGPLRIAPMRFTQTDFYVYPTRVDAELGHLSTPLFHQTNRPERVTIRFVRFAATTSHPGPPVIYLAGGPGGSGISSASGDRFPFFMALREVGDVIALEVRGVGPSSRQFCPGKWSYPLDHEFDEALLSRLKGDYLQSCWENLKDPDGLSAFNTRESAADLEDLRIALGAPQLNLVGISYGTHLALAYLRQYPDRVAGAVLAGVEGPDHTYKSPAVVESVIREIDRTLEEEAGWTGFIADFEQALEKLRQQPARVEIQHPRTDALVEVEVGALDLLSAVYFGLGEREDFLRVARRVRNISEDGYRDLARLAIRIRSARGYSVMPLSVDCASGVSAARQQRIAQEAAGSFLGNLPNSSLTSTCAYWPVKDLGERYRSPVTADVPVLAVSGTLDLRTPPSQAEEVLQGFPRSRHLKIVGGGHDDDLLVTSGKIVEEMVRFLKTSEISTEQIVLSRL